MVRVVQLLTSQAHSSSRNSESCAYTNIVDMACILLPIVPQNTTMEYRNIEYSRSRWGGSGAPGELFPQILSSYCFLAKIGEISGSHWYCGHESWQVFTFYITPP